MLNYQVQTDRIVPRVLFILASQLHYETYDREKFLVPELAQQGAFPCLTMRWCAGRILGLTGNFLTENS